MDREDDYSLQALDFTKSKMEKRINEDVFPVALDLSMHPSEPSCSTYVDGSEFTIRGNIQNYSSRERRFWDNEVAVAEDLRMMPGTSASRFESSQNPVRLIKGNRVGVHNLKQDELKVNRLMERKMKDCNELLTTRLFKGVRNVDEDGSAFPSFNFQKTSGAQADGIVGNTSFALTSGRKDLPFTEPVDCFSREILERNISTFDANVQNRQTVLRYCSETSLSEIARSSFFQSEESREFQDGQHYDEYAKRLADFLKSTASNRNNEQDVLSSSEESQADDAYAVSVVKEESYRPDADDSLVFKKEDFACPGEEGNLKKSDDLLDNEEFNEESLLDSKPEIATIIEPNSAENSVPADTGGKKRKRKVREVENSELRSSKPKRKKTVLPQTVESNALVMSLASANVFEYQWPQEKNADWFVLQEHVTEFLGILSFKRKYPDIFRRSIDISERNFLRERGVVTEMQCDLGLTALKTEDVCELMSNDYPEKYQEYTKLLSDQRKIMEPIKVHENTGTEKSKMETLLKKSIKSAADYNASLMRERYHERRAYFDLQTFEVHYPHSTKKSVPKEPPKIGAYPVSLIPGQYQDHYKRYTQQELNYFPLNTALYSPHKMLKSIFTDPTCAPVDDTEDDDGPDEGQDHISISKDKREDKRTAPENVDSEKQKSPVAISLDTEDSVVMLEDSAENSRSSFKESKISKTVSSARRMPRLPGKKKGRELILKCVVCNQSEKSLDGVTEDVVRCSECSRTGHPSCLDLTKEMVEVIRTYPWQCMECKTCVKCMDPHDEEKMMFCDHCDRGYHTFCVGLKSIPEGRWECPSCLDIIVPPKPKRGRPFKYPRPQVTANHVPPKADSN